MRVKAETTSSHINFSNDKIIAQARTLWIFKITTRKLTVNDKFQSMATKQMRTPLTVCIAQWKIEWKILWNTNNNRGRAPDFRLNFLTLRHSVTTKFVFTPTTIIQEKASYMEWLITKFEKIILHINWKLRSRYRMTFPWCTAAPNNIINHMTKYIKMCKWSDLRTGKMLSNNFCSIPRQVYSIE